MRAILCGAALRLAYDRYYLIPVPADVATLTDSGVEFVGLDNPHANKLTIHILAAVAEHEREAISDRTKAALAPAKARGTRWAHRTSPAPPMKSSDRGDRAWQPLRG